MPTVKFLLLSTKLPALSRSLSINKFIDDVNLPKESLSNVDTSSLRLNKILLKSDKYNRILSFVSSFKKQLKAVTLPCTLLSNFYIIPEKLYEDVQLLVKNSKRKFNELVDDLLDSQNYTDMVEDARERLGDRLFDVNEIPTLGELRGKFSFNYMFLEGALFQDSDEQSSNWLENIEPVKKGISDYLRGELITFLAKIKKACDPKVIDAEDKRLPPLRTDTLGNLFDFLMNFKNRNLADDEELNEVVEKLDEILSPNFEDYKNLNYRKELYPDIEVLYNRLLGDDEKVHKQEEEKMAVGYEDDDEQFDEREGLYEDFTRFTDEEAWSNEDEDDEDEEDEVVEDEEDEVVEDEWENI